MKIMKLLATVIGRVVYWAGWPFFWFYFRLGHGRTRIVLLCPSGEVLVTKNWLSDGKWSMPGGGMHKGEPVAQAAGRELHEETKITAAPDQLTLLGEARYRSHGLEFDMHIFKMEYTGDIRVRWYEIADAAWIRPETLKPSNAGPDVLAALQMLQ